MTIETNSAEETFSVGKMLGEKAETKELKLALSEFFIKKDILGAKQYILEALKKRPDVLMEASDLDGELKLAMQVITTCENEYKSLLGSILDKEQNFEKLITYFRTLNEVVEHIRLNEVTDKDEAILKEKYINCLEVSDIAVEIAILLMCSEDGSVERVKEAVKGIMYGI